MLIQGAPPVKFNPPYEFGRSDISNAGVTVAVEQGWAGTRKGTSRIEATLRFTGPATAEDRWAGIAFGTFKDDQTYVDNAASSQTCYSAFIRRNGTLQLYVLTPSAATSLGTFAGTAVATAGLAGTVRVALEVTATGDTFTNMTTGQQVTSTDTTVPRTTGRVALTFSSAACFASEVVVTDI